MTEELSVHAICQRLISFILSEDRLFPPTDLEGELCLPLPSFLEFKLLG